MTMPRVRAALAGVQGFEPQLTDPESAVLPLDYTPMHGTRRSGDRQYNRNCIACSIANRHPVRHRRTR